MFRPPDFNQYMIVDTSISKINIIFPAGWLYRKKYRSTKTATMTLQRWVRGFLARRRVRHMRKTKAAITLQRYVRGWVKRTQFLQAKDRTVRLQARVRGLQARLRHRELVRNAKAVVIQTNVRGYLARKKYKKAIRDVVLVQCQIRKFLAKKKLKKLKIQAKSMEHQKNLNKGLENKIILLQQKLSESQKANKELKKSGQDKDVLVKEVEALKASDVLGKAALNKVTSLEEQVKKLQEQLEHEKAEKIDLVNQRKLELDSWSEKEANYDTMIDDLKHQLKVTEEEFETKGQEASVEQLRVIENERDMLKNDCDQERVAYQKLLKAYNKLEAQFENVQDELGNLKNPNGGETFDSMSFASMSVAGDVTEDESAYGGSNISGISSVRTTSAVGGQVPVDKNNKADHDQDDDLKVDVGLTVRLQHKLKETQMAKDKLEKRLEQLEQGNPRILDSHQYPGSKRNADSIKINELEIETSRQKQDLKRLRETITNNNNHR